MCHKFTKAEKANVSPVTVFSSKDGRAASYRIPALVVTKNGTLVAVCDERKFSGSDFPNVIHKVVKASNDGGKTWGEYITAVEEVGTKPENGGMSMDPALLYDGETNRIFMLFTRHPANSSLLDADRGMSVDENGIPFVYKNKTRVKVEGGRLADGNGYFAGSDGNIIDASGKVICNVFTLDGEYTTDYTFFLCLSHSDDEGKTWSKPMHLNPMVKPADVRFICAGPGIGIKLNNGSHKGRLVFPIYISYSAKPPMECPAVIYSDDGGVTWHRGKSVNEFRKRLGLFKVNLSHLLPHEPAGESQIIECADGSIKMFIRNHHPKRRILVAQSYDGGETWQNIHFQEELIHCVCQCSAITTTYKGKKVTLFLNGAHNKCRVNGVIRASLDYGKTFPYKKQIKDGDFIYSSMVALPDGDIGVLYEGTIKHTHIEFLKISLKDIIGE